MRISDWSSDVCSSDLSADQPADHLGGIVDHGNDPRIVDAGGADDADGADDLLLGIAVGRDDHRAAGEAEKSVLGADENLHALRRAGEVERDRKSTRLNSIH